MWDDGHLDAEVHMNLRRRVMNACASALRVYTHLVPFARGRGAFIRVIEHLKRWGWPPPLIPIGHGLVMEFEPSLIGWTLFERGEWEPAQTALFLSLLSPGAVVLNVGANTGYYTLLAAAAVGSGGPCCGGMWNETGSASAYASSKRAASPPPEKRPSNSMAIPARRASARAGAAEPCH